MCSVENCTQPGKLASNGKRYFIKGYSPDNVKWATPKEQANNRRPRRKLVKQGV